MITFQTEIDGDQFHAFCPQLAGCHTFGATKKIALENLKEAVDLYRATTKI
jgi:predicted RNase H-like HicB family nuclease